MPLTHSLGTSYHCLFPCFYRWTKSLPPYHKSCYYYCSSTNQTGHCNIGHRYGAVFFCQHSPLDPQSLRAGHKRYLEFCKQFHYQHTPISEQLLCKFTTFLAINNLLATTIKVSAVCQLYLARGHNPPDTSEMPRLQ